MRYLLTSFTSIDRTYEPTSKNADNNLTNFYILKPSIIHIQDVFYFPSSSIPYTYNLDVTAEINLLSKPPQIKVLEVHGSLCVGTTCGNFRESTIINNSTNDDTIDIDYTSYDNTLDASKLSIISSDEFLQELREKIIEASEE